MNPWGDRYKLVRQLSAGDGTTEVWHATSHDGRPVAIKRLMATDRPDLALRFDAEGRLLRKLGGRHHVIECEAVLEDPPALVLELAPQGNLRDHIEAHGPLAPRVALTVLSQACDAIGWLHANGVVHRDVKPSNLVGAWDGTWRLIDLGVAAHGDPPRGLPEGWIEEEVGTPGWRAPELDSNPAAADPRIDIYGLAVTGLAMLAAGSSPGLETELRRAASTDPTARHASVAELATALRHSIVIPDKRS